MPQLGETVLEATVTRWLKKPGDEVAVDEPLVEVSTDKVDSEIPCPVAGTLSKILVEEGETVAVGAALAEIGGESPDQASPEPEKPEPQVSEQPEESGSDPAGTTPEQPEPKAAEPPPAGTTPEQPESKAAEPPPAVPTRPDSPAGYNSDGDTQLRGVLSPLVRKLASEHGVDLARVSGSGAGGRITKQDVLEAATSEGQAPAAAGARTTATQVSTETQPEPPVEQGARAPAPQGREESVKVGSMRRVIAEHMVASTVETARAWNTIEVDLTRIARFRERAGAAFKAREGFSLTWMPFVSKSLTQALLSFPYLNSTWNGDGTITLKHYVNLGVAVALDNGLIVPVIKGAESMNLMGLARAVRDVAVRARSKKLSPDDVQGGTFTITNPGGFGSIMSMAIINKGQSAILAFDAVVKRPLVVTDEDGEDSIAVRHMTNLSLSWDHRVIDGAEAAKFLAHLKRLLEEADFSSDLSGLLSE